MIQHHSDHGAWKEPMSPRKQNLANAAIPQKKKKCQIPQHFNTKSYVITDTETTTLYVNVRALIMQK